MIVWCNIDRFNSATLRITEDSAKQLMISQFIYDNIQKMLKKFSKVIIVWREQGNGLMPQKLSMSEKEYQCLMNFVKSLKSF